MYLIYYVWMKNWQVFFAVWDQLMIEMLEDDWCEFVWTCGAWSKDDLKNEIEQLYIIELMVL